MKAAVFHGPRDVRFEEIDKPILAAGEVLLKVGACGICGSDLPTVMACSSNSAAHRFWPRSGT